MVLLNESYCFAETSYYFICFKRISIFCGSNFIIVALTVLVRQFSYFIPLGIRVNWLSFLIQVLIFQVLAVIDDLDCILYNLATLTLQILFKYFILAGSNPVEVQPKCVACFCHLWYWWWYNFQDICGITLLYLVSLIFIWGSHYFLLVVPEGQKEFPQAGYPGATTMVKSLDNILVTSLLPVMNGQRFLDGCFLGQNPFVDTTLWLQCLSLRERSLEPKGKRGFWSREHIDRGSNLKWNV